MNNLPRQKLCEILKIYGQDACNDYKRIRGLLNDFCNGNHPEINFLLTALEEQVYTELVASSKTIPYEMLAARLIKRLCINRGMTEEIARWAVDSWALALGMISNETAYIEQQVSFNTPLSDIANTPQSYADTNVQKTIVVSPTGGQYTTISAALKCAVPNTIILVKPGYYPEGFIIDKRVEIRGDGPREQIIIESRAESCIEMQTDDEAIVQGLTLRCKTTFTNPKKHAVEIPKGRLKLIACDITSDISACVAISGLSARPEIQSCLFHDAGASGLFFEPHAQGYVEDCHIFRNGYPGISIRQYANPVIKRCKIYDGRNHGILIWENSCGTIEDCDIFGNNNAGVKVKDGGTPTIRGCRIYKNGQQDEWVYNNGLDNTRFPRAKLTSGFHNQRGNSEPRSEAVRQTEKRRNIIHSFFHSIRLRKEE